MYDGVVVSRKLDGGANSSQNSGFNGPMISKIDPVAFNGLVHLSKPSVPIIQTQPLLVHFLQAW